MEVQSAKLRLRFVGPSVHLPPLHPGSRATGKALAGVRVPAGVGMPKQDTGTDTRYIVGELL